MNSRRAAARRLGRVPLLVALAAFVALVAVSGSPPHTHSASSPEIYDQEHDFAAIAALGGTAGLLPQVAPVVPTPLAVWLRIVRMPDAPLAAPHRDADSRAPPTHS